MSSLFSRSKDYTRARKSQSDSPPSSPSPAAKTRHERLARLDSGSSSLSSTDSVSDRAAARVSAYTRRENRLASLGSKTEEESEKDFKKLYESAFSENEKLKTNLREAQLELSDIKSKLERVVKRQDHSSSQTGLLESEKREKRNLERRMSEMEDELKVLTDLKSNNQRLKDENCALIRVISKLSK
ncbi:protein phosphatase 1 regulatory subunit 12B isoform X2 [Bombina bombina]|uniref:protein phosphatase 1 regulatory subunit 12B isoform X2 n=1 Tax=Bombina bombina TaxID=8345 RepID=UPI00235ABA8C|nr:protein phosphatase 1 regulatory subunit 12B isoform X2 [Bombina bombina]